VVVGADGVHSGVRALAFGPDDGFVRHLGAYTAYFTVPGGGDLEDWFLLYNAPGGRVAGLRPDGHGAATAYLSFTSQPLPPADLADAAAQQRLVAGRMAGAGWRVPDLVAAMPQAPDLVFGAMEQVRVEEWARGRIALLGDAGYCGSPLAGHGTSLALTGAYVLAGELASRRGDPAAAFAAYQRRMQDYVDRCTALPPGGVSAFAPRSRLMIRLRAMSMRAMTRPPLRGLLAREFAKAGRMTLEDYPAPSAVSARPARSSAVGTPSGRSA
jgi:2-polyprenyl-6-methoxyphenol hydroxylase-like FAD-dependent oxidoreductase